MTDLALTGPRVCRVCGCTDAAACPGGCAWRPDDGYGPCCTACDPALPAWATVKPSPCVVASCTDCGDPFGSEDDGNHWHFEDLPGLLEAIAEYADDGADASWQVVGDALLCRGCAARRRCAADGHLVEYREAFTHGGRTIPAYRFCARDCGAGFLPDPTAPSSTGAGS